MKILIACEFSGIVRNQFKKHGYDAISCDFLPSERKGNHYQGNVFDLIKGDISFDMMIAFPPCTYICVSGNRWYADTIERTRAIWFVERLWFSDIPKICIENPVGALSTQSALGPPTQYIQPWEYGHGESKKTGLWLKNLPNLEPTKYVLNEKQPKIHLMGQSKNRSKNRSRTYKGIAKAMAKQWKVI